MREGDKRLLISMSESGDLGSVPDAQLSLSCEALLTVWKQSDGAMTELDSRCADRKVYVTTR